MILLNIGLLLVSPSTTSTSSESFRVVEIVFLSIFSAEAVLKMLAFSYHQLITPSGAFDLLILLGSLLAYSLTSQSTSTKYRALIQAGRIFRMLRVLRFIKLNRSVQAIFQTFRASIRSIANIFFLLFLIFFIFAIVGRQVCTLLRCSIIFFCLTLFCCCCCWNIVVWRRQTRQLFVEFYQFSQRFSSSHP